MIVYEKQQMAASCQGKYPNLGSMYNTIVRETREHMERVGRYSAFFYKVLHEVAPDMLDEQLGSEFEPVSEELFRFHDLGRVYIPLSVLYKVEALTDEEKKLIQDHTVFVRDAVKAIYYFPYQGRLLESFLDIALYHHERYDGNGYPEGRKGDEIPIGARICALADVFDGITSWKPYKTRQTTREKAGEIILSEAGKQFDPQLARIFVETIPYLPQ